MRGSALVPNFPVGQLLQEAVPVEAAILPSVQSVQASSPAEEALFPAAQGVHDDAEAAEYLPEAHVEHDDLPEEDV